MNIDPGCSPAPCGGIQPDGTFVRNPIGPCVVGVLDFFVGELIPAAISSAYELSRRASCALGVFIDTIPATSVEEAMDKLPESLGKCVLGPLPIYYAYCNMLDKCCAPIGAFCDPARAVRERLSGRLMQQAEIDPVLQYADEVRLQYLDMLAPLATVVSGDSWFTPTSRFIDESTLVFVQIQSATNDASAAGRLIDAAERAAILSVEQSTVSQSDIVATIERWNRTISYRAVGILEISDVPNGQSTDFITESDWQRSLERAELAARWFDSRGYVSAIQALEAAAQLIRDRIQSGQGVCVRVTIELEQRIAITRSAFRASLGLENPGGSGPVEAIGVILIIKDAQGNDASNLFLIDAPELQGLSDVSGGGALPEGASGRASWRIIPSDLAAPTQDTPYFVSGSFQYRVAGSTINVPLVPAQITVQPNASLDLKYFVERDVFGDDPFTTPVEPSIPYNLGLLMTNNGAGLARDVRIAAAEPRIVENDRGLVIDFDLIGTQVGTQETSPSLNIALGDIQPNGGRQVARWLFTSTLQGEFTEFEAEFVSLNGFNTPEFSLIDSISIFEMDHPVRAGAYLNLTTAEDDGLFDFLTNQTPDLNDLPDRLHQSNGAVDTVTAINNVAASVRPDGRTADINVSMGSGWTYIRITDPFNSAFPLEFARRSDGKTLLPGFNVWQTNKIQRNGPNAGQPLRFVHIFDRGGSGQYSLRFAADSTAPSVESWATVGSHGSVGSAAITIDQGGTTSEPRSSGVSHLMVRFDEPMDPATFRPINVITRGLNVAGNEVSLAGITVTTELDAAGTTGTIRYSPKLPNAAKYCITLNNVRDRAGNILTTNARTVITALQGDSNGDRRTNGADVSYVRASQVAGPITLTNLQHVRSDISNDGLVNNTDVNLARSANGVDTRAIGDPCDVRDGIDTIASDLAPNSVAGLSGAGGTRASTRDDPRLRANDESREWGLIETAFTPEGVKIRFDPRRFVIGESPEGYDVVRELLAAGVQIQQISQLGYENWLVVEVPAGTSTEPLRKMLEKAGVYTSQMMRDDAGEHLVPRPVLLVEFVEATPAEWRQQVLAAQFGTAVQTSPLGESMPNVIEVRLSGYSGDAVVAAANKLASRRDVRFVEPDFVMFVNRVPGSAATPIDEKLLATIQVEQVPQAKFDGAIDLVILDDGLIGRAGVMNGVTVFGGADGRGQPETLADVYGQWLAQGAASPDQAPAPVIQSVRSMSSLNRAGRAVTTTRSMIDSVGSARLRKPQLIATSAIVGHRSQLLQVAEQSVLASGIGLVRPSSPDERPGTPGHAHLIRVPASVLAEGAQVDPGITGAVSPAVTNSGRIGRVVRSALASGVGTKEADPGIASGLEYVIGTESAMREVGSLEETDKIVFAASRFAERAAIDLNQDGVISQIDLMDFVSRFQNGEASADLDRNGVVDPLDFSEFTRRFFAYQNN